MVKIRLRRVGAKKQPHYRVVVTEARSPRDGRVLETIGHFNPRVEPPLMEIDAERALYWLSVGAQPSEAVKRMLDKLGIMAKATAVKQGGVLPEAKAKPVSTEPEGVAEEPAEEAGLWEPEESEAEEEGFAEAEEEAEEEEDEFGEEPFEEDELDAEELWEPEVVVTDEEPEDFEDDWEMDVDDEDDDDIEDDDEPYEDDDE